MYHARQFGVLHGSMLGIRKLVAAAVWGSMLSVRLPLMQSNFNPISERVLKSLGMIINPGMFIPSSIYTEFYIAPTPLRS